MDLDQKIELSLTCEFNRNNRCRLDGYIPFDCERCTTYKKIEEQSKLQSVNTQVSELKTPVRRTNQNNKNSPKELSDHDRLMFNKIAKKDPKAIGNIILNLCSCGFCEAFGIDNCEQNKGSCTDYIYNFIIEKLRSDLSRTDKTVAKASTLALDKLNVGQHYWIRKKNKKPEVSILIKIEEINPHIYGESNYTQYTFVGMPQTDDFWNKENVHLRLRDDEYRKKWYAYDRQPREEITP